MAKYPTFVAVKLPPDLARGLRVLAAEDDRTISAYLRRLIASAIAAREKSDDAGERSA